MLCESCEHCDKNNVCVFKLHNTEHCFYYKANFLKIFKIAINNKTK